MSKEVKRDLQKVFEFIVKHSEGTIPWSNNDIRKMIKWALFYKKLFLIYDPVEGGGKRILACGIAWRAPEVNINYSSYKLDVDHTEKGNYLNVLQVVIHPEYRKKGLMFQLFCLAIYRFPGIEKIYWRDRRGYLKMVSVSELLNRLKTKVEIKEKKRWVEEVQPLKFLTLV